MNNCELDQFLRKYSGMSIRPQCDSNLVLEGDLHFDASSKNCPQIVDGYSIEMVVPVLFPKAIPVIKETRRRIPRDGNHHINPDGTICLGSPLSLMLRISETPTLICFTEKCLVPYLYAVSLQEKEGGQFIFGDLAHGEKGILDDYMTLFKLKKHCQVISVLLLLGLRKRIANKRPCPCQCGKRLGRCSLHLRLNKFRPLASRKWFSEHAKYLRLAG